MSIIDTKITAKSVELIVSEYRERYQVGVMEAIVMYCEETGTEPALIARKLPPELKDIITQEASALNLINGK